MYNFLVSVTETFKLTWDEKNISAPFLVLMLLAVYYLYRTKDRRVRMVFVYPLIIYVIVIFNPFVNWVLIHKLGFSGRTHRFFWMIPMVFILAWVATDIISQIRKEKRKWVLRGIIFFFCIFLGRPMYYEDSYATENIYKVTDEVLELSDYMKKVKSGAEKKVLINENHIAYMIRQYDASIDLIYHTHKLENLESLSKEDYENKKATMSDTEYMISYFCSENWDGNIERVKKGMEETKVEYLVLNREEKVLIQTGKIELNGKCGRFYIYQVN